MPTTIQFKVTFLTLPHLETYKLKKTVILSIITSGWVWSPEGSTNLGWNRKLKAVYGCKRESKRLKILILHNKALYIPFTKYCDGGDEIKEDEIDPLKTSCRLLYLKTQFVPRSKHYSSQL